MSNPIQQNDPFAEEIAKTVARGMPIDEAHWTAEGEPDRRVEAHLASVTAHVVEVAAREMATKGGRR